MEQKKNVKNIRELAALLNLSVTTVSRVLNGKATNYRISNATSERVIDAAKRLHYQPNKIARGLKMEKSETLGLIVPDIANPFFASMAKVIEIEARKNGYSLLLCDSNDDVKTERELLELMISRKVDGIIIAPNGIESEHISQVMSDGIPVMVIDRYFALENLPYVTTDNYLGALKAVTYIISQGHIHIACIQGTPFTSPNTERVKGYKDALINHKIPFNESLIVGKDFGEENGYTSTKALWKLTRKPTAIFALNNLIALGVMRAAAELGINIPEDISLLSFDEQPYSAFLSCPLSTIEQKRENIAGLAVQNLLKFINRTTEETPEGIKIEPSLIIRNSVKKIHHK